MPARNKDGRLVDIDARESTDRFLAAVGMAPKVVGGGSVSLMKEQIRGDTHSTTKTRPASQGTFQSIQVKKETTSRTGQNRRVWQRLDIDATVVGLVNDHGRSSVNNPWPPLPAVAQNQLPTHQTATPASHKRVPPTNPQNSPAIWNNRAWPVGPHKTKLPLSVTRAEIVTLNSSASLPSVGFTRHRGPGKRRDSKTSAAPSLPIMSDGWADADNDDRAMETGVKHDIRNTVGININYDTTGASWHRFSWSADKCDYDDFTGKRFLQPFIHSWRDSCLSGVTVDLLADDAIEHWNSDIDPTTGQILPPVDYPDTFPTVNNQNSGLNWRQITWTTTLLMRRRLDIKTAADHGGAIRPGPAVKKGHDWAEFPPDMDDPEFQKARAADLEKMLAERKPYNQYSTCLPCYLRSAEVSDMEQVVAIYNQEVWEGLQAPDSELLSVVEFVGIYNETQKHGLPFFVAVYGDVKKLGAPVQEIRGIRGGAHPGAEASPDPGLVGRVLGFGYLSVWHPGLAGSGLGSSRTSGRVNLYVDRDFRRKRVGFSLMDRLVSHVSTRFESREGYHSLNPSGLVCGNSGEPSRQLWRLYLSFNIKTKQWAGNNPQLAAEQKHYEDEYNVHHKTLDEVFNFDVQCRLQECCRTPETRPGPRFWLDSVLYSHVCHNGIDFS